MKRPKPDRRPSWRDPNLPCIRNYRMGNGQTVTEVSPDYERRYREHMMQSASQPHYRDDPTYNMRKPK